MSVLSLLRPVFVGNISLLHLTLYGTKRLGYLSTCALE
jgi:hypothetical protein